jgi:hypothetical protein
MSIELHCPKCGKVIRAPDNAGGKHGKCPYCKESVYVPMPAEEVEEIGLAPIDEEEEQRLAEERRRSIEYITAVDHGTDTRGITDDDGPSSTTPGEVVDVPACVEMFIVAMRDSKLEDADDAVADLKRAGSRAKDYVQGLTVDEMPPEVENVPPPVVQGFLKTLLNRLK